MTNKLSPESNTLDMVWHYFNELFGKMSNHIVFNMVFTISYE